MYSFTRLWNFYSKDGFYFYSITDENNGKNIFILNWEVSVIEK